MVSSPCCPRSSQESSPTPQFESISSSMLSFFVVQLSHLYMTTGKTIALTRRTFVGKVMSLQFSILSRFVIAFLPRRKHLLISWVQSLSTVILEPKKIKSVTAFICLPWSDRTRCHDLRFLTVICRHEFSPLMIGKLLWAGMISSLCSTKHDTPSILRPHEGYMEVAVQSEEIKTQRRAPCVISSDASCCGLQVFHLYDEDSG